MNKKKEQKIITKPSEYVRQNLQYYNKNEIIQVEKLLIWLKAYRNGFYSTHQPYENVCVLMNEYQISYLIQILQEIEEQ